MQRTFIFFIAIFSVLHLSAQTGGTQLSGSRSEAMGGVSTTFQEKGALLGNVAGLAAMSQFSVTVSAEQRFLLAEIRQLAVGAALPTSAGTFGISAVQFGNDLYSEQKIGLAYARKLMSNLQIGAQFDYLNLSIEDYGQKDLITFEVGMQWQVVRSISLGAHVFNPVRTEILEDEKLPTLFALGLQYQPTNLVTVVAEVEKDLDYEANVKVGIEYAFQENLFFRTGISTNPVLFSFGVGYQLKNGIGIDVATSMHQVLGWSPSVSLVYQRSKKG